MESLFRHLVKFQHMTMIFIRNGQLLLDVTKYSQKHICADTQHSLRAKRNTVSCDLSTNRGSQISTITGDDNSDDNNPLKLYS